MWAGTGVESSEPDDCLKAGDERTETSRMMGKFLVENQLDKVSLGVRHKNKTSEGWCLWEPSKEKRVSNMTEVQGEGGLWVPSKS